MDCTNIFEHINQILILFVKAGFVTVWWVVIFVIIRFAISLKIDKHEL